jgi:hypothetical protein
VTVGHDRAQFSQRILPQRLSNGGEHALAALHRTACFQFVPALVSVGLSREVLEALWRNVLVLVVNGSAQEELALVATTLFCNVFSHHSIALSDEEFFQHYTTAHGSQVILAEYAIVHLRTMLHDLYWSKPVLATDVSTASSLFTHNAGGYYCRARNSGICSTNDGVDWSVGLPFVRNPHAGYPAWLVVTIELPFLVFTIGQIVMTRVV